MHHRGLLWTLLCSLLLGLGLAQAEQTLDLSGPSRTRAVDTLSGIVASGKPLSAEVVAINTRGEKSAPVDSDPRDGSFRLQIPLARPYLLRARTPQGRVYYSFAEQGGEVNITPLTHLALFMSQRWRDPDTLWQNWPGPQRPESADIRQAAQRINHNLRGPLSQAGVNPGSFDIFTTPFSADGKGFDAVLDKVKVELNTQGGTFELRERATGHALPFEKTQRGDSTRKHPATDSVRALGEAAEGAAKESAGARHSRPRALLPPPDMRLPGIPGGGFTRQRDLGGKSQGEEDPDTRERNIPRQETIIQDAGSLLPPPPPIPLPPP